MQESPEWDMIIRPKRHIFDINLKEVWSYRDLLFLFVRRDFVAKYKQTILGPFWFILNPLLSTFIYTIIFSRVAKIPTDNVPPVLFYLTGLIAWQYFAACLTGTSNTFVANSGIFGKVYFPRLVSPISVIMSSLVQLGIQFSLLVAIIVIYWLSGYELAVNQYALLIPVIILVLAFMALGFGIIISSATTKYRDLTNFMAFGVQLWMYATPIIYPISSAPEKLQFILKLNPVAPLIEAFKFGIIGAGQISVPGLIYSLVFTIVLLGVGVIIFNKVEQSFMDTV
jgi:lipopolysaccharide transport system permease protein